ncbi:MAG: class I SAM-dependent methyltransferase [Candidatus Heimdallarchaeaceae archaeon]
MVRQIGICVPLTHGEKMRRILLANHCIDQNLSFNHTKEHLIIPVKCSKEVLLEIIKQYDDINYTVDTFDFQIKKSRPRNLSSVLESLIPKKLHQFIPKAYDQIGTIIVIDIPQEIIEYKQKIGETVLSLFPSVKTVYRKRSPVTGQFRIRELELIAGEKRCDTIHVEHKIRLYVDVCNTYFSPRLGHEHHRIAKKCKDNETIVDLFTGVGAFPIHITTKTNATVYAVDINPAAIECVKRSVNLNKLKGKVIPVLGDCRRFSNSYNIKADKVIMNLPSHSHEYINVLCNIIKSSGRVFFYHFVGDKEPEQEIKDILAEELEKYNWIISKVHDIHKVRESAPYELHMCIEAEIIPKKLQ